jgi:predicted ester cyclase
VSTERNKAIACRLEDEVWNHGNLSVLDELASESYTVHDLAASEPETGRTEVKNAISFYRSVFPDMELTVEDAIAEGDKVAVRWKFHATHQGEFMAAAPTRRAVTVEGIDIFRFAAERIEEAWVMSGDIRWLREVGADTAYSSNGGV